MVSNLPWPIELLFKVLGVAKENKTVDRKETTLTSNCGIRKGFIVEVAVLISDGYIAERI